MARVAAAVPDLLFGSKVQGALQAGGHDVVLGGDAIDPAGADVLVVDLTGDFDGIGLVQRLRTEGRLGTTRVLGFFAHVEPEVRDRALQAGFDQVVPRSRMAREGSELVARLARG